MAWASITHSHCLVLHSKRTEHFTSVTTSDSFCALKTRMHVLFIVYISYISGFALKNAAANDLESQSPRSNHDHTTEKRIARLRPSPGKVSNFFYKVNNVAIQKNIKINHSRVIPWKLRTNKGVCCLMKIKVPSVLKHFFFGRGFQIKNVFRKL